MPLSDLTETDRRLLQLLQSNARATTQELADAAGMSSSPTWRRLKRLEDLGIIKEHVTLLDRRALGLNALAYVHISLTEHTEATVARFDSFVQSHPNVMECARVTGNFDYVLKVVAAGPEDLEEFLMRQLLSLGLVRTASTSFVLRPVKSTTALPLR